MATCDLAKFHMVIAHFFVVLAIISHSKMIPFELASFSRSTGHAKSTLGLCGAKTLREATQECVTCVLRRACRTTSYNRAKGYNQQHKNEKRGKNCLLRPFPFFLLESPKVRFFKLLTYHGVRASPGYGRGRVTLSFLPLE